MVPKRLAIWDPDALRDPDGDLCLAHLTNPDWPYDALQLRIHGVSVLSETLTKIASTCHAKGVTLWTNRDLELAKQLDAAGVQMGLADLPSLGVETKAAKLAIGCSVHVDDDLSIPRDVDFYLLGNLFATPSKPDKAGYGLEQLRAKTQQSVVPIVAIGGVDLQHETKLLTAGADGWAAIRAAFLRQPGV